MIGPELPTHDELIQIDRMIDGDIEYAKELKEIEKTIDVELPNEGLVDEGY